MNPLTAFHADIKPIPERAILYTACRDLRGSQLRLIMRVDSPPKRLIEGTRCCDD